jgi:hypothetical protein
MDSCIALRRHPTADIPGQVEKTLIEPPFDGKTVARSAGYKQRNTTVLNSLYPVLAPFIPSSPRSSSSSHLRFGRIASSTVAGVSS